ncbi:hypothetical protein AB8S25_26680, partial [Klebsiella pneumoniae]
EIFFGLMKRQRNGREKFIAKGPAVPWTARRAVLVYALAANGSQTGEGYIQGAGSAGPRKTSKPRPRQLNG